MKHHPLRVLFVSHPRAQCGVYEFGLNASRALEQEPSLQLRRVEIQSRNELVDAIAAHDPQLIIYNFYPGVMPWVFTKLAKGVYRNNIADIPIPQVGIIHEVTQQVADTATAYRNRYILGPSQKLNNSLFDAYIAPDPTLLLKNPLVYKTGRLVPAYAGDVALPAIPTIGSFGFGTPNKGFEKLVELVQNEFDEAHIRLQIPAADFGDSDGAQARTIAAQCQQLIHKPGIKLSADHRYLDNDAVLDFLAGNHLNVFLYSASANRGISSTVDYALAVNRPLATSNSSMFRHMRQANVFVSESNSLSKILQRGADHLMQYRMQWDAKHLGWEYSRITRRVLERWTNPPRVKMGIQRTLMSIWNRWMTMPDKSFTWLRNTDAASDDDLSVDTTLRYKPVTLPVGFAINRILNDQARAVYAPAIQHLFQVAPRTMAKKIAEANVQQGFVFDTVSRYLPNYPNAKLLCVGSYEDTASMALTRMGYNVEEIDPMINYYLQEYVHKPSVMPGTYDIVFSTSVIEHDPNDASFVEAVTHLLKPGGVAVITMDFLDGWKPGDLKPEVDARLYTKQDLTERLLQHMPGCTLVDTPQWDIAQPDFTFLGKYRYSFASFVVQKQA